MTVKNGVAKISRIRFFSSWQKRISISSFWMVGLRYFHEFLGFFSSSDSVAGPPYVSGPPVVQRCTAGTASGQEQSPAELCETWLIVKIKWNWFEIAGVDQQDYIWTSLKLFHWDDMWCLTAEEVYRDPLCWRLLRDPAMPGQTDSHLQCRVGCRTYLQHSSLSGVVGSIGELELWIYTTGVKMSLELTAYEALQEFSKNGEVGNRAIWAHIRLVKLGVMRRVETLVILKASGTWPKDRDLLKSSARYSEITLAASLSYLVGSG